MLFEKHCRACSHHRQDRNPASVCCLTIGASIEGNDVLADAINLGTLGPTFETSAYVGDAGAGDVDLYRVHAMGAGTLVVAVSPSALLDTTVRLFDESGSDLAVGSKSTAEIMCVESTDPGWATPGQRLSWSQAPPKGTARSR